MIPNQFDRIDKADVDALVSNGVPEGRTIEYKRDLPGNADEAKREFLADVSSFANAAGGDILYGVSAPDGIPTAAEGLAGITADKEILRLDSIIRNGIAPRIPGVQSKALDGFANGPVLMLRVPQSWTSPHMVIFKNLSRFYSRTSAGKFQLDVTELRAAFLLSEAVTERMKRFRDDRLAKIVACETPLPMEPGAKAVLHLLPVSGFIRPFAADVSAVARESGLLAPLASSGGWNERMNLDGFVTFWPPKGPCYSYTQLFRTGAIEAVDAFSLTDGKKRIRMTYERDCVQGLQRYTQLLPKLGIEPPVFVVLSLLGVKGFTMGVDDRFLRRSLPVIDRDAVLVPEIVLDDFAQRPESVLKPIFDTVWQAAGLMGSENYNKERQWAPRD